MIKSCASISIKELPQSEVEIKGTIHTSALDAAFEEAIMEHSKATELPGFRKGKAPRERIIVQFGESFFLNEAAHNALATAYPNLIEENKISPIGHPKVVITKLAKGNPLEFTITVAIVPKISLPDYKKIAHEVMATTNEESVTEKEIDDVIVEVRKHHAHMEMRKNGVFTDHNHPEVSDTNLPPLDDELVKKLGDFKDVSDMREKLHSNLTQDKKNRSKEKKRMGVIEKIIEKVALDVPIILINNELDTMLAQFEGDISRAGGTLDEYLKTIGKSIEEIRKEWNDTAIKKARAQLLISKIAAEEKLLPDSEKVRAETEKILTMYPDADPVRARSYVAMMLTNEKVFEFFELQK